MTAISLESLTLPLTEPFAIAGGAPDVADNLLVRLQLADGTVGLGEAAPFTAVTGETAASTRAALERGSAQWLGADARGWRPLCAQLAQALPEAPSARCALETALLDALARHYRTPLWVFFGGAGTALETDMTVTAGDVAHALASTRAILARGIHTLKVKVGALEPEGDLERLVAIRAAAPHARLFVDANGGYSLAQARAFLKGVAREGVGLALFEQPVHPSDLEGMAALTREAPMPICADESARSAADVLRLVRAGAASAVNIKAMKYGVAEALHIWSLARTAGLELMVGAMLESILAASLSAHLAAGLGGFSYVDLDTPLFIARHPFRGGSRQEGARLSVAEVEAGHGVQWA
ncbi:dipeptide epimerase [Aggregicoccus sp. 17bor-14]|uniref:dipeptide epimerase n=1 Tax=Myxococcaceae TaxID=31 RepID=UPI00351A464A